MDLHVIDPSGEEIYYQHKTSASGGTLDRDDTHGPGPENIFWPKGAAPTGTYKVFVKLYQGDFAAWRVRVLVDGKAKTFNGTLSGEGCVQDVTEFTRKPPEQDAK